MDVTRYCGNASYCEITGVLGKSEEPSPRFMITGEGYEVSSSNGVVKREDKKEVCIGADLRDENLHLETIPLGTTIAWTEFRGEGGNYDHKISIKVVLPSTIPTGRRGGKKS